MNIIKNIDNMDTNSNTLHACNISASLHGFQNCYIRHDVVHELLSTFNGLLVKQKYVFDNLLNNNIVNENNFTSIYFMSGRGIGNALYGLRNMSANYKEVRELLTLLIPYMSSPGNAPMSQINNDTNTKYFHTPHNISNAIYGLRRMNSSFIEVRMMVAHLAKLIQNNIIPTKDNKLKFKLSPQEVSNIIYGLQSLSSDYIEVKQLIRSITPYISTCNDPMSSIGIANMLYGMKNLNMNDIEVVVLWNIIVHLMSLPKNNVNNIKNYMKPKEIGIALYGLSNYSSDYSEIKEILELLINYIPLNYDSSTIDLISATNISCMIYGFKSMKTINKPVLNLLNAILPILKSVKTNCTFNKHHLYMCLIGIRYLDHNHIYTQQLMDCLVNYTHLYTNVNYIWTNKQNLAIEVTNELESKYNLNIQYNTNTHQLEYNHQYPSLSKFLHFIHYINKPTLDNILYSDEEFDDYIDQEERT